MATEILQWSCTQTTQNGKLTKLSINKLTARVQEKMTKGYVSFIVENNEFLSWEIAYVNHINYTD